MVRYITEELGFEPMPLEGLLPEMLLKEKEELEEARRKAGKEEAWLTEDEKKACIQLLPGYMGTDGFFIARFRRPQR